MRLVSCLVLYDFRPCRRCPRIDREWEVPIRWMKEYKIKNKDLGYRFSYLPIIWHDLNMLVRALFNGFVRGRFFFACYKMSSR